MQKLVWEPSLLPEQPPGANASDLTHREEYSNSQDIVDRV